MTMLGVFDVTGLRMLHQLQESINQLVLRSSIFSVLLQSLSDFGSYGAFTVTCVVLGELTCPLESVTVSENINTDCVVVTVGAMKVGVTVFAPLNDTAGPAV